VRVIVQACDHDPNFGGTVGSIVQQLRWALEQVSKQKQGPT
jgi:hypothetical protein